MAAALPPLAPLSRVICAICDPGAGAVRPPSPSCPPPPPGFRPAAPSETVIAPPPAGPPPTHPAPMPQRSAPEPQPRQTPSVLATAQLKAVTNVI